MITAIVIWCIGAGFTMGFTEKDKSLPPWLKYVLCACSWPHILGMLLSEDESSEDE